MNISAECELMENHKNAIAIPDKVFKALQSRDGSTLLFSRGKDNAFYLTRELAGSSSGWDRIDLSHSLTASTKGTVKKFRVAQNANTLEIDLALVLTIDGSDSLYHSVINPTTDDASVNSVTWTKLEFDSVGPAGRLTIGYLYLMSGGTEGKKQAPTIFVDLVLPADSMLPNRYSIVVGPSPHWRPLFKVDPSQVNISSYPGQRTKDAAPGLYTFYKGDSGQHLTFTLPGDTSKGDDAPKPISLNLPAGASAVTSALNSAGATNLFVAGTDGLFLFTPDNQEDSANPVPIVSDASVANASSLAASTIANRTAVWGLDAQNNLFYVTCPAGNEKDSTAWSSPVPLVDGVSAFAFFLNRDTGSNVLITLVTKPTSPNDPKNLNNQELVQLTQDPVTTGWQERSILLPPASADDIITYNSFTTHIQVSDDNGIGAPNTPVTIKATNPAHVFINDIYYRLSPGVAVSTTTDITGVLTVIQQTHALSGGFFSVTLTDTPDVTATVNPIGKAMERLSAIHNGSDLSSVQVPDGQDGNQPLVTAKLPSGSLDAAAKALAQFVQIHGDLPPDGSRGKPGHASKTAPGLPEWWGVSLAADGWAYHESDDVKQNMPDLQSAADSVGHRVETTAGDFLHWARHKAHEVDSFVLHKAEDAYHFVSKVGGEIYHFTLDCLGNVGHAVQFILEKLKVEFDQLKAWLGSIFQWGEILRIHVALKRIFIAYVTHCLDNLDTAKEGLKNAFTDFQKNIDQWAKVPSDFPASLSGSKLGESAKSAPGAPGQHSPQSNLAVHHLKSNLANATTAAEIGSGVSGSIETIIQPLIDALQREKDTIEKASDRFKKEIIDQIHDLPVLDILKTIADILADAVLQSIENVLLAAIDILAKLTNGGRAVLNAAIKIPVLSALYKNATGEDLSFMDLVCLIVAIPVTVAYAMIGKTTSTSARDSQDNLTKAADLAESQKFSGRGDIGSSDTSQPSLATHSGGNDTQPETDKEKEQKAKKYNDSLMLGAGICSGVGTIVQCFVSPVKLKNPNNKLLAAVAGFFYVPYVAPDIFGQILDLRKLEWWALDNQVICDLMISKAFADAGLAGDEFWTKNKGPDPAAPKPANEPPPSNNLSAWLDFIGNAAWLVPALGAMFYKENWNPVGALNLAGNLAFDVSGMMSPWLAYDPDEKSYTFFLAIAEALNIVYGLCSVATGVLPYVPSDSKAS